jgi:hypothetical protein
MVKESRYETLHFAISSNPVYSHLFLSLEPVNYNTRKPKRNSRNAKTQINRARISSVGLLQESIVTCVE